MLFDDIFDIGCTAITQFQSVHVENLMVFVVDGEMFPRKLDEQLINIYFHILAVWRVERYNLSVSISLSVLSIDIIKRY